MVFKKGLTGFIMILLTVTALASAANRSIIRNTADLSHASGKLGVFRALVIGIDDYQDSAIPDLQTAVNDARVVGAVLEKRYGFKVTYLLNQDAGWKAIERALRRMAATARPDDSVLIFYAGHGERDRQFDDGWWIPADARAGDRQTFIDNTLVQKAMRSTKARHVLLIADSCYAGTLFGQRTRAMPQTITDKYYLNIFRDKSRWGLTSGGDEPVADLGGGGHSIFAGQLLKTLRRNQKPYLSVYELFQSVAPVVINETDQEPQCRPIRNAGGDRGEFVFVAASPFEPPPTPTPRPEGDPEGVMWGIVSRSDTIADYQAFLKTYPNGKFAPAARVRLAQLRRVTPTPAPTSAPKKRITNSLGMEFVYIPPGEFMMGQTASEKELLIRQVGDENYKSWYKDELPRHKVRLTRGFYLQTTEVTVGQWRRFVKATGYRSEAEKGDGAYILKGGKWEKKADANWKNPYFQQTDDHPVTCVSWNDVQQFVDWLNQKGEGVYRLPTEAQWEYACRAGATTPFAFGECLSTDQANYNGNNPMPDCPKGRYREKTIAVASFKPNRWGLYDMHGNVWEWCEDWYGEYLANTVKDPRGPENGEFRVLRGGGWISLGGVVRSAVRYRDVPGLRYDFTGFRLARGHR